MAQRRRGVSPKTDDLASTLLGAALDVLANGDEVGVMLAVGDAAGGSATYVISDDGSEALLEGARTQLKGLCANRGDPAAGLGMPARYALVYEGCVDIGTGTFTDALLLEFGETSYCAYSAYCLYDHRGAGDDFSWTDPAPAGEVEPLL